MYVRQPFVEFPRAWGGLDMGQAGSVVLNGRCAASIVGWQELVRPQLARWDVGLMDEIPEVRVENVSGAVRRESGVSARGPIVRAFQTAGQAAIRLCEDTPGPEGGHSIRCDLLAEGGTLPLQVVTPREELQTLQPEHTVMETEQ